VIVGVLASDTLVRRPVPKRSDPEYPLQLRKLRVRVENVLRGDVTGGTIEVYYFAFAGGFDGPQPLGMWSVGSRRILWLRRDSGVLRTARDGGDSCTRGVYSGAHPHLTVDPRKPIIYALADILLTRGEGEIDDDRFAGAIEWGAPGGDDHLMIEKFRHLANEAPPVKTAACIQLWICAQDQGPDKWRRMAREAMLEADCGCVTKSDGSPDCGTTSHIASYPPM